MSYFVYIVQCVDKTLYTGSTSDISKRIIEHNSAKRGAKYTKSRRPVILKYVETVDSKNEALSREYEIKQMTKTQKMQLMQSKCKM